MTNDQYLSGLLSRPPRRRFSIGGCIVWVLAGIMFVVFLAALIPNIVVSYPVLSPLMATAGIVFSTAAPVGGVAQPVIDRPTPTLILYRSPVPQAQPAVEPAAPTLTLPPAPTAAPSFWTPEEQTQIAATATAFIEVIPTAPPEFKAYVDERCKDEEIVAQSWMLQQMCGVK